MRASLCVSLWLAVSASASLAAVESYEGTLTVPTYVHSGREMEPPLFGNSTVTGLYPFPTYLMPFQPDSPKPRRYAAVFVENEYLKLSYIPEFGGRIFSVYDKVRKREVFYRNDVIKPAHYNPRLSWPQSGLELTGPYDAHMLTLYGEPFWSHTVVRNADGSISLVLGEIDPVYHMRVNLTATLHPGIAALQIGVFCYNRRDARMPQMFWINTALPATEKLRFVYPMSRTIGHTTAEIADWPVFNGVDYSLDRNNRHMLGVFGIDIYGDFQGAYDHGSDYGVFRYADRRIVQGMKMWTFGYGPGSKNLERGYTDNAGPYVEVQSGRHVWDGHYEWVAPHKVESWSEWWVPVAGIGGLTTLSRDVALNLRTDGNVGVALSAVRSIPGAKIEVRARCGAILSAAADLGPGRPFERSAEAPSGCAGGLRELTVTVADAAGREVLRYVRPDENPGRKEYTPFTRPLEKPAKKPEEMSAEELTLAAEFRLKELNGAGALDFLKKALARDPGYSRAHLLLGVNAFVEGRYRDAVPELEKAIERDPYLDEAYYYLSLSQIATGREREAERNLYYIWPASAYFADREYQLARIALSRGAREAAAAHLDRAIDSNGLHISARLLRAVAARDAGASDEAEAQLQRIAAIDPASGAAAAERFLLTREPSAANELRRLTGAQSQEALSLATFYTGLQRWRDAAGVLEAIARDSRDVWGTPPEFYYVLAYCYERAGDGAQARAYREKARAAGANLDRFPYREESEAPLAAAVAADPGDAVARYLLGCLLYFHHRPDEAIRQWEAGGADFRTRRALGLAYAEQGRPVELAAAQLERAVDLNPAHTRTLNDLSNLYARAGQFDKQLAVLQKALSRSPGDDDLAESVLTANLITGRYADAEKLVSEHRFAPRHRTYSLRDKYRLMRYGLGADAFRRGDYKAALGQFQAALKPPVSLGMDDFESQTWPRVEYAIGRALEALGDSAGARQAYERCARGAAQLSGDRDSWNTDNFSMVLSLEKLGRTAEAAALLPRFESFARTEVDSPRAEQRAEARYLLALVKRHAGAADESKRLLADALAAKPDFLPARLEARGDSLYADGK